jgi:hypothetical protein
MRKLVVKKEYTPWKGNAEDGLFAVDIWVRTEKAQELWCDISVPEPACASYLALGSDKRAGRAAAKAESNKRSKYKAALQRHGKVGVRVVPLIIETGGYLGREFTDFLKTIEKESSSSGPSRAQLLSQISITLVKANVEMVREAGRKALLG